MHNLDMLAATAAQRIIEVTAECKSADVDNLATKALGVLQENGVYAGILFLYSRTGEADKAIAPAIRRGLLALIPSLVPGATVPPDSASDALSLVSCCLADDLEVLLLVKQVWEQALIYLRYGAKARGGEP